MGAAHSVPTTNSSPLPSPTATAFSIRTAVRKRSTNCFSLSCTTLAGSSVFSVDPEDSTIVEKSSQYHDAYQERQQRLASTFASLVHIHSAQEPSLDDMKLDTSHIAFRNFLCDYPEYQLTWILDMLRKTDFGRLEKRGETYVDYMGGALYPESLVNVHASFLSRTILGNTHSVSNSSRISTKCATDARQAVLSFFKAPPGYTVVFTSNATAALKLVGESYPFTGGSSYVLCADSHNSLHGIREFAAYRGARTCYIASTPSGGFDQETAQNILLRNRPRLKETCPSIFGLTAQSNITNAKNPLSILAYASGLGYHTVLDAAAYVPTSSFSLTDYPVDAMAISFYKIFGYPTGIGALIVKEKFLAQLKRPWFSGGNVDVVQVPGDVVTRSRRLHEQFEDGTINYLNLSAVTDGLRFLSAYLPFLPLRLSSLLHYLAASLAQLRHGDSETPVVRILSRLPSRRLKFVGDQADTGFIMSMIFLLPSGEPIPNAFIEYAATRHNISLRTGCMCNSGGAAAILGIQDYMKHLYPGVTLADFETIVGHELGVVRISLGLSSSFADAWKVLQFASTVIGDEQTREAMWYDWLEECGSIGTAI